MKIHLITIGKPKLTYAKQGWEEYSQRLGRLQQFRATHLADKHNDAEHIMAAAGYSYKVALIIDGNLLSSEDLAVFLHERALEAREVSFIIGGPEGLPQRVIEQADYCLSLSRLTLPHDLAMVVTLEALYRACTIHARLPYHK